MKKFIARILRSFSRRFNNFSDYVDPKIVSEQAVTHSLWLTDNGDKTLRLNYGLSSDDIVLDVGGYEGQWASDIFSRYVCLIHIFEPVPYYADMIESRFSRNNFIKLHKVALGRVDDEIEFSIAGDASSSVILGDQTVKAHVVAFSDWYKKNNLTKIALMKINIEGGEYELLEHLIETGLIDKIKNLQVQFHNFFPDAERRMFVIQQHLEKTHQLTYQYKFVWENWTRREQN